MLDQSVRPALRYPGALKTLDLKTTGSVGGGPAQLVVVFDDGKNQAFDVSLP